MKRLIFIMILITSVSFGAIWWYWPKDHLNVIMCDVGQGDAMLITLGFQQILIDAGIDEAVLACLTKYMPFWDRKIEIVIISHLDADHAGGLQYILPRYHVKTLVFNDSGKQTKLASKLREIINSSQTQPVSLYQGDVISLKTTKEDIRLKVVWPEEKVFKSYANPDANTEANNFQTKSDEIRFKRDENNMSISGVLEYGQMRMLLTGDIDIDAERAMISTGLIGDVDILKVPHHGSKHSTSEQLLQHSRPETALIGVGENNSYGHPTTRVIDLLRSSNIDIYRTDIDGDIRFVSDGRKIWRKN